MASHTPGPWTYEPAGDSDGEMIGIDHFVMAGDVEMACPRTEADARLIAAAPDMLYACQEIVAALNEYMADKGTQYPSEVIAAIQQYLPDIIANVTKE